ncbi:RDD family protein [Micromonospora sp. NBC_01813]|uniref:RDD family protein n=1 Tax=Micromonospora sp. NBC_01813 TaxID=2975988 RepID=UPI002DDBBFB6|nr:RDD family protein [Micromonospora sp. NBC_01813]WSA08445.1 RDD family protein [Micromonospora sp. NBC_01813]
MTVQTTGGTRLVGGEAVEVEVRLARVGSRVLALLFDLIVQAAIALVLVVFAGLLLSSLRPSIEVDEALGQALLTIGVITVLLGYPVLCETLNNGRTVGKMAVGIRVVRDDGGPPHFRHALTRNLVGVAAEWPGLLLPPFTWVASLVTMLANGQGKRLGDLAAGTLVVHDRVQASWGWVPGMPSALADWARTLDLTRLDDELALSVRHLLARGHGFAEPARSQLVRMLAAEVAAVTAPPPPAGLPGWAYLAAVLAERHRRAGQRLARSRAVTATLWPELTGLSPTRASALRPAVPVSRSGAGFGVALAPVEQSPVPEQWRGPAAPAQRTGPEWPQESWPRPPWLGPTGGQPDWTGVRRPPVASTLRTAAPDPADQPSAGSGAAESGAAGPPGS